MFSLEKFIYLILLLLPTYLLRFEIWGIPLTVLEVFILLLFLWFFIERRGRFDWGSQRFFIGLFLAAGTLAIFVSSDLRAAAGLWKAYLIEPVMFYLVFINVKPDFQKVIKALGIGALFVSLLAVGQYFTGYGIPAPWNIRGPEFRVTSIFEYPNAVGLYLAPIVLLILGYLWKQKSRSWLLWTVVIFSGAAILFSQTQGAIAAILFGLFIFGILSKRYRYLFYAAGIIGWLVVLILPWTREIILLQDVSGQVRLALWQGTINLLAHHPLVGAGLAGFPEMYAQYKLNQHTELLLYPHNLFLDFWVELGFLGLVCLLRMLVKFFWEGLRRRNSEKTILIGAMAGVLLYGLVDVVYFKNDLAVLWWTLFGLMEIFRDRFRQHRPR